MLISDPVAAPAAHLSFSDYTSVLGVVAQVAVAVAAVYVAHKANTINRNAIFVERLVDDLLECRGRAAQIRDLYCGLFEQFADSNAKREARNLWVRKRDELSRELHFLADAFPEVAPVRKAWGEVEDEEDTHVQSDATTCNAKRLPIRRYDAVDARFSDALSSCIRALRSLR